MSEGENVKEGVSHICKGVILFFGINSAIGSIRDFLIVIVLQASIKVSVYGFYGVLFILNNPTFTMYEK